MTLLPDLPTFKRQPQCPDCVEFGLGGCYAPLDLPDDWRDLPDAQTCEWLQADTGEKSCRCWGGPDRECEDCWLASK